LSKGSLTYKNVTQNQWGGIDGNIYRIKKFKSPIESVSVFSSTNMQC